MNKKLGILKLLVVFVIILGFSNLGTAKDYPKRPIKLVVPWGAGGSSSMSARIVVQAFTQSLEAAMVVVNKPGAGGTIGAAYAANAKPDGYTLFQVNSGSNGVSTLRSNLGYSNDSFHLIGQYASSDVALVVRADAPWKTVGDLVEYAKKNPGKLKYAGSVSGTDRFGAELFMAEAGGLKIKRVPVSSGAEVVKLMLSGDVEMMCGPSSGMRGLVNAGKLRFMAYAKEERSKVYPGVPTFKEAGYPGVVIGTWYGLATPLGVPENVSRTLEETLATVMKEKVIQGMLKKIGHTPTYKNADDFRVFVKRMEGLYQKIANRAGIKID
jgi:tripartite-type tricarboxylate transporter receptor subunit TctC